MTESNEPGRVGQPEKIGFFGNTPRPFEEFAVNMTKLDFFAAAALASGKYQHQGGSFGDPSTEGKCYDIAARMLAESERRKGDK